MSTSFWNPIMSKVDKTFVKSQNDQVHYTGETRKDAAPCYEAEYLHFCSDTRRLLITKPSTLQHLSHRVVRFAMIEGIALLGWIVVQTFFAFSPLGKTLPFVLTLFIEVVWWSSLLLIMLLLFLREYNRFVQAALDLEDANKRLRVATNTLLQYMSKTYNEEETAESTLQDGSTED